MTETKKKGLTKILEVIKTYSGYFFAVVAIVTFIYAAGIKSERKNSDNLTIVSDIRVIKDSIVSISGQIKPIRNELNVLSERQLESKNAYNSLRLVVLDMASKAPGMTIEQFKQYIENTPILKKNSMLNQLILPKEETPLYNSK
jgi:hypothetical protein